MNNYIDQFLEMLLAERGLSKNSASAYKKDLYDLSDKSDIIVKIIFI